MVTLAVTFMLFNLLAILFKASLKSDWNIKHATRSPKWGISLSSNKNCSGLSSGWSGWEATCSLIKLNSSAVADYAKLQIIYYNNMYIQTRLVLSIQYLISNLLLRKFVGAHQHLLQTYQNYKELKIKLNELKFDWIYISNFIYLPFSISEKSKCKLWANMPTFRDLFESNSCLNSYNIVEIVYHLSNK